MIARLGGTLVDRLGTHVVIDCGGVGYEVNCSTYTCAGLPPLGEKTVLRVFTHAQENRIALYGFLEQGERQLFDLLITVKNVGPSTALAILSGGASPRDLASLIAKQDLASLTRIKGVGKKTAELLAVELREKCDQLLLTWAAGGTPAPVVGGDVRRRSRHALLDEVAAALVAMGWRPAEADAALADVEVTPEATLEVILRQALRSMPR